jgi:hypothetical protein
MRIEIAESMTDAYANVRMQWCSELYHTCNKQKARFMAGYGDNHHKVHVFLSFLC